MFCKIADAILWMWRNNTFDCVFEQKARPKSDQEENELVVSCLRRLYEDRQKTHTHNGQTKKVYLHLIT